MESFLNWLAGKKTHLVVIAAIVTAVSSFASGQIDGMQFVAAVFSALGFSTIRAGIAKGK